MNIGRLPNEQLIFTKQSRCLSNVQWMFTRMHSGCFNCTCTMDVYQEYRGSRFTKFNVNVQQLQVIYSGKFTTCIYCTSSWFKELCVQSLDIYQLKGKVKKVLSTK